MQNLLATALLLFPTLVVGMQPSPSELRRTFSVRIDNGSTVIFQLKGPTIENVHLDNGSQKFEVNIAKCMWPSSVLVSTIGTTVTTMDIGGKPHTVTVLYFSVNKPDSRGVVQIRQVRLWWESSKLINAALDDSSQEPFVETCVNS